MGNINQYDSSLTKAICFEANIHPNTLRPQCDFLRQQGYVVQKHIGKGTFVANKIPVSQTTKGLAIKIMMDSSNYSKLDFEQQESVMKKLVNPQHSIKLKKTLQLRGEKVVGNEGKRLKNDQFLSLIELNQTNEEFCRTILSNMVRQNAKDRLQPEKLRDLIREKFNPDTNELSLELVELATLDNQKKQPKNIKFKQEFSLLNYFEFYKL